MDSLTIRVPARALRQGPGAHDVHTASWKAASTHGYPVVCVHGLGGSHVNWSLVAPKLAALPGVAERVWAPDLAGFGLTPPTAVEGGVRSARLAHNLDLLAGFIRTVSPDRPVLVMGNSMGGLLSLLLAAHLPELVAGLVVVNPALPAPVRARLDPQVVGHFALFALPGVGERVLELRQRRLTPLAQIEQTLALCVSDPAALDPAIVSAHAALAEQRRAMPWAHSAFLQAARDIVRMVTVGRHRVWDAVDRISAPALYLQGARDRLVHRSAGALLVRHRPDWTHRRYPDLAHLPMIEDPSGVAADVGVWIQASVRAGVP